MKLMNVSRPSRETVITIVLAVLILIPSMYGFVGKFLEFVHVFRGESDGQFAISPMTNYLLASGGFLCLFIWSISNGMFTDMEQPKRQMLENEITLDSVQSARHRPVRKTSAAA